MDKTSLVKKLSCNNCGAVVTNADKMLVKCSACNTVQLFTSCVGTIVLKFNTNIGVDMFCPETVVLPKDIEIGHNDDFLLFILGNSMVTISKKNV